MSSATKADKPISGRHLPALDGLRGFASLFVLHLHMSNSGWNFSGGEVGYIGLLTFFVLSGFLMSYHYLPGSPTLRHWADFGQRRLLRMLPAYWVIITFIWVCAQLPLPSFKLFSYHQLPDLLLMQRLHELDRPFWTVKLEVQFYSFFLLAGILSHVLRIAHRQLAWWCALTLLYMLASYFDPGYDRRFVYFMGGVITGELYKRPFCARIPARWWNICGMALLMLGLGFTFGGQMLHQYPFPGFGSFMNWLSAYSWWFLPVFMLVVASAAGADGLTRRFYASRPLCFLGHISYSLYMLHIFIDLIFRDLFPQRGLLAFLALQCLILAAATASHFAVERPAHRLARRISRKLLA